MLLANCPARPGTTDWTRSTSTAVSGPCEFANSIEIRVDAVPDVPTFILKIPQRERMETQTRYTYLEQRPDKRTQELFIRGTGVRTSTIWYDRYISHA